MVQDREEVRKVRLEEEKVEGEKKREVTGGSSRSVASAVSGGAAKHDSTKSSKCWT